MHAQREQLMKEPLSRRKPDSLELTQAQVQRLGNKRLDSTLQQVSDHDVWKKGLGLWDHVSALRKDHVLPLADDATARFQSMFSYDGVVTPNGAIPSYEHPCVCHGGGVCRRHDLYEHVARITTQFDSILAQHKLAVSEPLLLCIAPEAALSDTEDPEPSWLMMGCVSRRPIVHYVLPLWKSGPCSLQLLLDRGLPKISTVHRIVLSLLQQHVASGGAADGFAADAP